jgi:DNA-binding winged helix-turn-helix (wHTH) protein/predicted ATPase
LDQLEAVGVLKDFEDFSKEVTRPNCVDRRSAAREADAVPVGGRAAAAGKAVFFPGFRFETATGRLWRDDDCEVPLRPKTASVLGYLLEHAGDTVPKQELLEAVWPDAFVGDAVLAVSVNELRQALADDPRQPDYIATAHRRGYRFVAPVSSTLRLATGTERSGPPFVGRDAELALLAEWWEQARRGERQVGFVAAQAGVGKTALLDVFLERLVDTEDVLVGRGQCVEQFGEGEAYLPLLDALSGLSRGPEGRRVRDVLRSVAPTWLLQLPGVEEPDDVDALRVRAVGMSADRMLREVGMALEVLSVERPVLVVLEDLHHSDRSTTELLAYVARRRDPARVLIVGTYRPAEVVSRSHPLRQVVRDLRAHRQCQFLPLELLARPAVAVYLDQRLAPRRASAALVDDVHERTDGNALFVTTVVDYLLDRDLLVDVTGEAQSREPLARLGIPDSLGQFIERQLDDLGAADRHLLEVASVVGVDFSAEEVLAGARPGRPDLQLSEVDARCSRLARDTGLLAERDLGEWPDGTVTAHYRFDHALYQEVLYGHLSPTRRSAIHRRIGERLAAGYGPRAREIAGELAMHFERGRDYGAAIQYLTWAADTALHRVAHREALDYAERGLQLLERTEATRARAALELQLLMKQTVARFTLEGYGAPGIEASYRRARALCAEVDDPNLLGPVLYGLWTIASLQISSNDLDELADALGELARRHSDPVLEMQANVTAGHNHVVAGRATVALPHLERCLELYDPDAHRGLALVYSEDPAVASHSWAAWASWLTGYPDRARHHADEACRLARDLGYPNDIWEATSNALYVHVFCRDTVRARELVEALRDVYDQHGLTRSIYHVKVVDGWATAQRGEPPSAFSQLADGPAELASRTRTNPLILSMQAETLAARGDVAAALETATRALETARRTDHRQYEAEHVRLVGELLLGDDPSGPASDPSAAEAAFTEALEIARRHRARSLELRAATSLSRLWQSHGQRERAHDLLAESYDWFTEGHDTHDLRAAAALLAELE